eukprot:gene6161-7674_t
MDNNTSPKDYYNDTATPGTRGEVPQSYQMARYQNMDTITIQLLNITIQLFEMAGQSIYTFYDLFITLPEYVQIQIKKKNGPFQKLKRSLQSSSSLQSNNGQIKIKSTSIYNQQQQSQTNFKDEEAYQLSMLRNEIAKLMSGPTSNSNNKPLPVSSGPPPPPPPPPPIFKSSNAVLKKSISGTPSTTTTTSTPSNISTPTKSLTIADILKSGQKVQLKKSDVVRSPGGTPMREPTKTQQSTQDMIANALKKKFKNTYYDSPEKSNNHDDSFNEDFD